MNNFSFHIPVKVIFGKGKITQLNEELPVGAHKVLIVSDTVLYENTSIIHKAQSLLCGREVLVFKDIQENPTLQSVERGGELAVANKVDLVIGLGGGSAMDAAKGIAIRARNPENLAAYVLGKKLKTDPLPVFCIPTTSGTGSEVTPFAVFTDPENEVKLGYSNEKIFPKCSIIDPELTYTMPESLILNTGLDSLTHAVEAYLSNDSFELNNQIALHSIGLVLKNLSLAVKGNHEAMDVMAYSAMLSGIAIAHASTILPHIMGYPLTVYHGVPHGRAGTLLLPVFIDYLKERGYVPEKIQVLEKKFKIAGGLRHFLDQLGVSVKLRDYGVDESELEIYVKKTIVKGDVTITPGEISEDVILQLYQRTLN